jgi:hypothetical protein
LIAAFAVRRRTPERRAAALIDGDRRDERERYRAPASRGRSSHLHLDLPRFGRHGVVR